jgi:hypothetical protein
VKRAYKIISIILTVILLVLFFLTYVKKKDKTIVDYYNDLPAYFFFDKDFKNLKYTLNQKKGIWISQSLAEHEFYPTVDLKKGYIKINDEGTGGGNVSFELFLFKKSNGHPIIAITKGSFDGFYYDSTTRFYTLENNIWIEAKNVFPKFEINRFLKDYDSLVFKNDSILEPNLSLLIQLNPNNFTATLSPNFDKYNFLIDYHLNTLTQKPFTDEAYDKLVGIVKNITIESFQLEFDKSLGRFEVRDSILRKDTNAGYNTEKDIILNKLSKLKIVRDLASYIDSASQKKRSLELIIVGEDQNNSNYIIVKAMEDNGGNFVTHFTFKVQKDNYEVLLYAPLKDKYLKVE